MSAVATATDLYRAEFEAFAAGRPPGEPEWLQRMRREAIGRFEERGFPTTSDEDWRFTNVAPIARAAFRREAPAAGERRALKGVEVGRLAEVLARAPERLEPHLGRLVDRSAPSFADLNAGFVEDGTFVS